MRRAAPLPTLSPAVLRHFAVLTVVITGGIAMFAHGENESFLAEQVRQRQMQTEALRAQREKASQRTVVVDGLRLAPGTRLGNADVGDNYVTPTNVLPVDPKPLADFPQAAANGPVGPPAIGPDGRDAQGIMVPPPALHMRMRGKPGQPQSAARRAQPSEQEVNAMIQASAQRAGRASVE